MVALSCLLCGQPKERSTYNAVCGCFVCVDCVKAPSVLRAIVSDYLSADLHTEPIEKAPLPPELARTARVYQQAGYSHEQVAELVYQKSTTALRAEIARLRSQLAECYRLTGADPDGNDDVHLAEHVVGEVKRFVYEASCDGLSSVLDANRLRAQLAALRPYVQHRLTCDLFAAYRGLGQHVAELSCSCGLDAIGIGGVNDREVSDPL